MASSSSAPPADTAPTDVPAVKLEALRQVQSSDTVQTFLSRSTAAQERAQARAGKAKELLSATSVRPTQDNAVPCPLSISAGGGGGLSLFDGDVMSKMAGKSASEALQDLRDAFKGQRGQAVAGWRPSSSSSLRKKARERSVNRRFRFREKQPCLADGPGEAGADRAPAAEPPQSVGGFASARGLTPGLPVRIVEGEDEAGVRAWCRHCGLDEDSVAEALAMRRQVCRVLEVHGERLKVSCSGGSALSLPVQLFTACAPAEILLHIAWRAGEALPPPSDFIECVAAADHGLDPGVEPGAGSDAIQVSALSSNAKVRRFKTTPAVGWPGVHTTVVRHVVQPGRTVALPPDGARVKGRLFEAMEACRGQVRRLTFGLPKQAEFRLGDGDVCDMLECAIARMPQGEIAALCCSDLGFWQSGGPFFLEAPLGREGLLKDADGEAADGSEYRILVLFQVLEVIGSCSPPEACVTPDSAELLDHAIDRKEAGTRAFKAGRTRLALERYRRTANFVAVYLPGDPHHPAQTLLQTCWLNAALCHLMLGEHAACRRYCDAVLLRDPENIKAMFRRATACHALGGQHLQVMEDLGKVVARDPANKQARQLLRQVQQAQSEHDKSCRDVFKRACGDLVSEFETLRGRLDAAVEANDGAEAEAALGCLLAASDRLTSEQAQTLRLGKLLASCAASPPGGSAEARRLAEQALAGVRRLVMAAGRS